MTEHNPYTPPVAEISSVSPAEEGPELASRWVRLGAAILDGIILLVPIGLVFLALYLAADYRFWVPNPGAKGMMIQAGFFCLGLVVDLAINGALLLRHGQTVGKRLCGIKVIKPDGQLPSFTDIYLKRRLLFNLAGQVPFVGGIFNLVDALLIFRADHRCLHDQFADTLVVKA